MPALQTLISELTSAETTGMIKEIKFRHLLSTLLPHLSEMNVFLLHGSKDGVYVKDIQDQSRIDLPFRTCGIEHIEDDRCVFSVTNVDDSTSKVLALIIHESSPEEYVCATIEERSDSPGVPVLGLYKETRSTQEYGKQLLSHVISQINSRRLGSDRTKFRFRLGSGKERTLFKINKIIHCVDRSQDHRSLGNVIGRQIDWSHRWEVMGHWRKIEGTGKDREGEYKIGGYTWVIPHEKGPEGKPTVKKTRIISAATGCIGAGPN